MFYNGTVGDVETIVSNVLANSKCMVVKQLPKEYGRTTFDWDLWTKRPHYEADILQKSLDKKLAGGKDQFYEEKWDVAGSNKPVYRVKDRASGQVIADFMAMPSKTKGIYVVIGGVRWETLENMKKVHRKILSNPEMRHRHSKSRQDLQLIEAFETGLKTKRPADLQRFAPILTTERFRFSKPLAWRF